MDFTGQYNIDDSDYGREQRIGQADVPSGDALATSAQDAWVHNPTQALGDMSDYYLANNPDLRTAVGTAGDVLGVLPGDPGFGLRLAADKADQGATSGADDFVDAHTLNQQYGESLGLSFDQPQRQGAVDILAAQKRSQLQRDYVLAHAPSGTGWTAANLGTSLAVSAADPLNVAAAFVPVVGEARAGMWAARYGSTAARIGEGAISGAAGVAALQPIEAARDATFDQQYGPMDAFTNVAFGSILGGGLHAGFGALSDWLGRASPETREAALRSSVAQMAEGRPVDVSAVLASDPALETPTATNAQGESGGAASGQSQPAASYESTAAYQHALADVKLMDSAAPSDQTLMQFIRQQGGLRTKNASGELTPEGGDLMNMIGDNPGHVMNTVNNTSPAVGVGGAGKVAGQTLDQMLGAAKEHGWLRDDAETGDLTDLIDLSINRGEKIYHPDSGIYEETAYRALVERELAEAGISSVDDQPTAARKLAEFRESQGQQFAIDGNREIDQGVGELSPDAQRELQSDDEWIGSDDWLANESGLASGDEVSPVGAQEAQPVEQPVGTGLGGREATGGEAGGARTVPAEFADRLDDARTASEKFGRNQEPSTLAPADAGAKAEAQVRSGDGDNIDNLLAQDEQRVADYHAQGILSDDEVNAAREANQTDAALAKSNSDAAKAAARCLWLHP